METYYVIQFKPCSWKEEWRALSTRYATLEEAKAALDQEWNNHPEYRIAQAYYQVRYKAVKV